MKTHPPVTHKGRAMLGLGPAPCCEVVRYFFDQDDSGHWYMVESNHRSEWRAWRNLPEDDEAAWEPPQFSKRIDGDPTMWDFENPKEAQ